MDNHMEPPSLSVVHSAMWDHSRRGNAREDCQSSLGRAWVGSLPISDSDLGPHWAERGRAHLPGVPTPPQ
eukprot:6024878-Amphidinium_carterae.1